MVRCRMSNACMNIINAQLLTTDIYHKQYEQAVDTLYLYGYMYQS